MEKIEKDLKDLFFDAFENDDQEIMERGFRILYKEDNEIFFTIEANKEDMSVIRQKWAKIKRMILEIFQVSDLSYIDKIDVDGVFLSKLIEICNAKKVELVSSSKKAS